MRARVLLTRGTLTTRLVLAGILLLVGLPVLTILIYVWGYPSAPVPRAAVVVVDTFQVLIVLNAIVVIAQLALETRIRYPWVVGTPSRMREVSGTSAPAQHSGPIGLRALSLSLAEAIWEQERNGRAVPGQAILDYIRDAVTAELEYRRRVSTLERRLADLEVRFGGGGTAASRKTGSLEC
ncbi:MAG TPA: hypothetical protein VFP86_13170 [bacterium]|nr:hypothetical protein [bacterium]